MFKRILFDRNGDFNPFGAVVLGIILVLVAIFTVALFPFTVVNPSERGVVTRVGAYSRTLQPGMHWITPFVEDITKMNVQIQKEQADATAASKDLQDVNTTVAVNYKPDESKIKDLYVGIGADYKSKVIDPAIQEVVKATTAQYTAEELITKRSEVTGKIKDGLIQKLIPDFIIVTDISITEFKFSDSFSKAIEAKVTAEQDALASKNKLAQVQYEADQRVAQAQGEAEAIKIQAQAINSQGGADYVALQAIKQWNGVGCASSCFGSGTQMPIPFFNLK